MSRIRQARRRVRDALVAAGLAAIGLAAMPGLAPAQERPYAPSMTCAALKATVDRLGDVVVATSANAYETVHRDSGACTDEVTAVPAFQPTADVPQCFAGYRCRDRNNGGDSSR